MMLSSQQDSVSMPDSNLTRLTVGVRRFAFAAKIMRKQIRIIDFKRKKTDEYVCRRVGLGGLLARRFAF
jgi:hypothetical protein